MQIGQLAKLAGVPNDTARYDERQGLLPPPPRQGSGYRRYEPDDVLRLRFISGRAYRGAGARAVGVAATGDLLSGTWRVGKLPDPGRFIGGMSRG